MSILGEIRQSRPFAHLRTPLWRDPLAWLTAAVVACAFVGGPGGQAIAVVQAAWALFGWGPVIGRARTSSGGRAWLPALVVVGLACALASALTGHRALVDADAFAVGAFFLGGLFVGPLVAWTLSRSDP